MDNKDPQNALIKADAYKVPEPYRPPVHQLGAEADDAPVVLDYWRILVKRTWLILASTLAVAIVAAIHTWKEIPIYRASATIIIAPEQRDYLPYKDTFGQQTVDSSFDSEYVQTQIMTIKSLTLATRVVKALNLESQTSPVREKHPVVHSKIYTWVRGIISSNQNEQKKTSGDSPASQYSPLASSIVGGLEVAPVRGTQLVQVSFTDPDPVFAAKAANMVCSQYVEYNMETKYFATQTAVEFLAKQLIDFKANLEKSEEALIKFGHEKDIVMLDEKGNNVVDQKLTDLNTALTHAQMDALEKKSTWQLVQNSLPGFPDSLRSSDMVALEGKLADLRQQEATLSVLYKPGWPDLAQVKNKREEVERQLVEARARAINGIENDYRAAVNKEKALAQAFDAQTAESTKLSQNSIQYNILKREVETNKQLYDGFLQRLKEAGISAGLKSSNVRIVDAAEVPGAPETPDKPKNIFYGLMAGFASGVLLAFFMEHLDSSVKTPDDVDRFIKLPTLGIIPLPASVSHMSSRRLLGASGKNGAGDGIELITFHNARSLVSEAYRSARTSVLLSSGASRRPKSLLVTSSLAGEGKTTTALNLSVTLCQAGEKVLLLDCDLRNPKVQRHLNMQASEGMSEYLSGVADVFSMLIQETVVPNLFVVTAGKIPPNPAELVGSENMRRILALCNDSFDHIVIDSPPLLSVSDGRVLASIVDGVILVIKGGDTAKQAAQRSKRLLQEVHANIIGTILNSVDVRSADYHYYSRYYYHYGYYRKYGYGQGEDAEGA